MLFLISSWQREPERRDGRKSQLQSYEIDYLGQEGGQEFERPMPRKRIREERETDQSRPSSTYLP